MLPRTRRLQREGFESARSLRRAASPHFSLSYGKAPGAGGAAVVVSKKVAKLAVSRHLLKRRVLSVIAPYVREDEALIVHARPGAAALPFPVLKDELVSLLSDILPAHSA